MELNTEQRAAVRSPACCNLVIAGAGSGKTRVVAERIRYLVKILNVDPNTIAAVTFTNKAAAELRSRLEFEIGYCGTLHSFCLRAVHEFHIALGMPSRVTVLDEQQSMELLAQCEKELRYYGTKKDLYAALKPGPHIYGSWKGPMSKAQSVAGLYFYKLTEGGMVDFDCLLAHALHLAKHGNRPAGFQHLLVDEYQDSGDVDAELYEQWNYTNNFFVGDPRQSIYSFRGANVQHILDLARPGPVWSVHELTGNYRCDMLVCEAANRLMKNSEWSVPIQSMNAKIAGLLFATEYPSETKEVTGLAKKINESLGAGVPPVEIAVLARTNHLVDFLSDALTGNGVPVARKLHGVAPADWRRVKLMVSFAANPDCDPLARQFIAVTRNATEATALATSAAEAMTSINRHCLKYKPCAASEAPMFLSKHGASYESLEQINRALALLPMGAGAGDLLLAMSEIENEPEVEPSGVTVCTIHAAKGREFSHVYLPAFEQSTIPGTRRDLNLAEERRIAYVAITRAKHFLSISWSATRTPQFGSQRPLARERSQFVFEALPSNIESM